MKTSFLKALVIVVVVVVVESYFFLINIIVREVHLAPPLLLAFINIFLIILRFFGLKS